MRTIKSQVGTGDPFLRSVPTLRQAEPYLQQSQRNGKAGGELAA